MGVKAELLDSGCCGMAGSFGFEAGHYDVSMKVGEHALLPRVAERRADTLIIADGFSCREQIAQITDRRPCTSRRFSRWRLPQERARWLLQLAYAAPSAGSRWLRGGCGCDCVLRWLHYFIVGRCAHMEIHRRNEAMETSCRREDVGRHGRSALRAADKPGARRRQSRYPGPAAIGYRQHARLQVPVLAREQARIPGRMVARSHGPGVAHREGTGGREYAAGGRRHPRTALAQSGRVVHHALRRPRGSPRIDADGRSFVEMFSKAISGISPREFRTRFRGLGPDGAEFLLVFDDGHFSEYETVLLSDVMAHTPRESWRKNFGIGPDALARVPAGELFIFQAPVPGPLRLDQARAEGSAGHRLRFFFPLRRTAAHEAA